MVVEVIDGVAHAFRGDVQLLLWKAAARAARVREAMQRTERLIAQYPEGILIFQIILPSSDPPDADARAVASVGFSRNRDKIRGLVTVAIGDGFRMSIVRTVMRAASALAGMYRIAAVEANEAAGLRRLLERAGPATPSRHELEAAMAALHEALCPGASAAQH